VNFLQGVMATRPQFAYHRVSFFNKFPTALCVTGWLFLNATCLWIQLPHTSHTTHTKTISGRSSNHEVLIKNFRKKIRDVLIGYRLYAHPVQR